jgi:Flp pilus assembly pilin Flp
MTRAARAWRLANVMLVRGGLSSNTAQNVVEYGIIIATIAVVVLLSVSAFGTQVAPWFMTLAGRITTTGT